MTISQNEAPRAYARDIRNMRFVGERNPSEAKNPSLSSICLCSILRSLNEGGRKRFFAKEDKKQLFLQKCSRCGKCCRLFLINLNKKEWGSGWFQTELKEFDTGEDFSIVQKYGGNILRQKKDGSCIYLKNNLCSIHKRRPQVCRDFSCISTSGKFQEMIGIIKIA